MSHSQNSINIWLYSSSADIVNLRKLSIPAGFNIICFELSMLGSIKTITAPTPHAIVCPLKIDNSFFDEHFDSLPNRPLFFIHGVRRFEDALFALSKGAADTCAENISWPTLLAKIQYTNFDKARKSSDNSTLDTYNNPLFHHLTLREHQIVFAFLQSKNWILKREDLYKIIWGKVSVHPKTLDVHLFNLRKKLRQVKYDIQLVSIGTWKLVKNAEVADLAESDLVEKA